MTSSPSTFQLASSISVAPYVTTVHTQNIHGPLSNTDKEWGSPGRHFHCHSFYGIPCPSAVMYFPVPGRSPLTLLIAPFRCARCILGHSKERRHGRDVPPLPLPCPPFSTTTMADSVWLGVCCRTLSQLTAHTVTRQIHVSSFLLVTEVAWIVRCTLSSFPSKSSDMN